MQKVIEINCKYGLKDDDFLFIHNKSGKRMLSYSAARRIRKYCDKINIPQKSMHKIRKTYISTLIDSGLNINEIRKLAGHSDEKTTYKNYCFNRFSDKQTEDKIEEALNGIKKHKNLATTPDNEAEISGKSMIILFKVIRGNQKRLILKK